MAVFGIASALGTAFVGGLGLVGLKVLANSFIQYQDQIGQRSETDKIIDSSYGKAIPLIYGYLNRISGNVIYYEPILETKHKIKHTNGWGASSTYTVWYTYSAPRTFIAVSGRNIFSIKKIWANSKLIYDNSSILVLPDTGFLYDAAANGIGLYESIAFYNGNQNSLTYGVEDGLQVPCYNGISFLIMKNLQLADFGNALPNFEFEVDGGGPGFLSFIIYDLCTRCGLTTTDYSIDPGLNLKAIDGMVISQSSSLIDNLKILAQVFPFDIIETPDRIYFQESFDSVSGSIDIDQMGATQGEISTEYPLKIERLNDYELPNKVDLTFIDPMRDYQENTQTAERQFGFSENNKNYNFKVTMYDHYARKIADRLLYEPWTRRMRISFNTSIRFNNWIPGKNISVLVGDYWQTFKIQTKKLGANGIIAFEAISNDPYTYDGYATPAGDSGANDNSSVANSAYVAYYFNAPYIQDGSQPESATFVVNAPSSDGVFRGGDIYRSTDGGSTYSRVTSAMYKNITGIVQNVIGSANKDYWDRENSIIVNLDDTSDELISLSETSVMNGNNWIWVGSADGLRGEIIGFKTATLLSNNPKSYELKGLLRGLRCTEHNISNHGSEDIFVYLSNQILYSFNYGYSDLNRTWMYKAVPVNFTEPQITDTQNFKNTGEMAKPRSPVHCKGFRDDSNNLTITWMRRTRLFTPGIGYGPVTLDEVSEQYQIDFYNAANTAIVRTVTIDSVSTYTYTAANQTTDGLTPGNLVNLRIYQISQYVGRGYAGVFKV